MLMFLFLYKRSTRRHTELHLHNITYTVFEFTQHAEHKFIDLYPHKGYGIYFAYLLTGNFSCRRKWVKNETFFWPLGGRGRSWNTTSDKFLINVLWWMCETSSWHRATLAFIWSHVSGCLSNIHSPFRLWSSPTSEKMMWLFSWAARYEENMR